MPDTGILELQPPPRCETPPPPTIPVTPATLQEWQRFHRLPAQNMHTDPRYLASLKTASENLTLEEPANVVATRQFVRENFPDYNRYRSHGLYTNPEGTQILPADDPVIQEIMGQIVREVSAPNRAWDDFVTKYPEKALLYAPVHHGIQDALARRSSQGPDLDVDHHKADR